MANQFSIVVTHHDVKRIVKMLEKYPVTVRTSMFDTMNSIIKVICFESQIPLIKNELKEIGVLSHNKEI